MPYQSDAQRRYFNVPANRKKLEAQGVDVNEWNESSKGKKLPDKVKEARCWKGYEPVPGKAPYSEDSCRPVGESKKKKKSDKEKAAGLFMKEMKSPSQLELQTTQGFVPFASRYREPRLLARPFYSERGELQNAMRALRHIRPESVNHRVPDVADAVHLGIALNALYPDRYRSSIDITDDTQANEGEKEVAHKEASALGRLAAGVKDIGNNLHAEDAAIALPVLGAGLGAGAGNLMHRLAGVLSPQPDDEKRHADRHRATMLGAGVGLGLGTRGLVGAVKGKIDQLKHDAIAEKPQLKLPPKSTYKAAFDTTQLTRAAALGIRALQQRVIHEKQAADLRIKMARLILTKAALRKMAEVELGTQCKTCGKAKCTCGRAPAPMHDLARGGARPG